jgi:hypothetical protein
MVDFSDITNMGKSAAQWSSQKISEGYDGIKGTVNSSLEKSQMMQPRGTNKMDATKYAFDQHTYPDNLMSEAFGGNYAIFYINISDDSKLAEVKEDSYLPSDIEPRYRTSWIGKDITTKSIITAAGVAGAAESLVTGGGIGGALTNGAGAAIGTGAIGLFAPDNTRSLRRLKTAIALHIPNQLSVRYGMQWSEEDSANIQAAQGISDGLMKALDNKGAVNKMVTVGAEAAASLALNKVPNAGAISSKLGIAGNPKKEQTFKGVDFRKFTFDYQFFPRSSAESRNVLNIIETFKLHMHPEFKTENQFVYIYPSEFDITYYTNHVENKNIHRHTSCVLEEMTVNYTPNGNFNVFKDGMPTQINITLGFRELMLLSKETIAGGF